LHKNEKDLGKSQGIFLAVGYLMKLLHGVIGYIAESAAEERRDPWHRHCLAIPQEFL
jgi:hypothetical protein